MAALGLPHWMMIGGFVLVLAGLVGLALTRRMEVEADPASLRSRIDDPRPSAAEAMEDVKAEHDGIPANTAGRAREARDYAR